jgi:cell division protein FtsB
MSNSTARCFYVVRRQGKVQFEGDLKSLRIWLRQNRIESADEIKRQGLELLEGDRLWALVSDREELGYDLTAERANLRRSRRNVRAGISLGMLLVLAGLTLLTMNQFLPRYDALHAQREAINQATSKARGKTDELSLEIHGLRKSLSEASDELQGLRRNQQSNVESAAKSKVRMVSLVEPANHPVVSIVLLHNWLNQTGIRSNLNGDNESLTLLKDGSRIAVAGNVETGAFIRYTKRFTLSFKKEDFVEVLFAITIINAAINSGKVVLTGDNELEFRFSCVVAAETPASVLETFMLESTLASNAIQEGLKKFLR